MKSLLEKHADWRQRRCTKKRWLPATSHWRKRWLNALCIIRLRWLQKPKQLLDLLGVPWVDAKAEGEGQAAVMAAKGQLDVVATQDWDALLYGTPLLVRNLMSHGSKQHGRVVQGAENHPWTKCSMRTN